MGDGDGDVGQLRGEPLFELLESDARLSDGLGELGGALGATGLASLLSGLFTEVVGFLSSLLKQRVGLGLGPVSNLLSFGARFKGLFINDGRPSSL